MFSSISHQCFRLLLYFQQTGSDMVIGSAAWPQATPTFGGGYETSQTEGVSWQWVDFIIRVEIKSAPVNSHSEAHECSPKSGVEPLTLAITVNLF